jgi:two-component system cell cycle sensor histidine kinase/response regulator CckA
MKPPPQPSDEPRRLEALQQYDLLDTLPEQSLDDLTALAAHICGVPISLISLVDEHRQWFKSKVGLAASETPRDISFCGHAILQKDLFIVPDAAQDKRFADNPLVTGDPKVRFYAAAPLVTGSGHAIGTLCIIDRVPHELNPQQQEALRILSRQVMAQLELRRQSRELVESESRLFKVFRNCPVGMTIHRWSDRKFVDVNAAFTNLVGWPRGEVIGHTTDEIGLVQPEGAARLRKHLQAQPTIRDVEVAIKTRSGQLLNVLIGTELIELRGETHAITTFVDITERKNAEAKSQQRHQELQFILDTVPALVFYKDREGRFLRVNRELARIMGVPAEDFVGKTDFEMGSPEGDRYRKDDLAVMSSGQPIRHLEERLFTKDGVRWLLTDKLPHRDESGRITGVIGFSVDITERKQAEVRIQHLIRVYSVLSDINQTIVREKDPQVMLESACRIAVEKGQLCMAWIGLTDVQTGRLQIAAHAGASKDTLEFLNATLGNRERKADCTFTLQALQTGEHGVCNDIANDPRAASWRNAAQQRGYYAMASLPLKAGGKTIGTFNLYAGETGFFDEEELRLLDELAMDIGFGVEIGQRENERRAAEERNARQRSALIALTGHRDLDGRDVPAALRLITEAAARTLGVARVSIWRYNRNHSSIECADLFELEAGRHSSGSILSASTHPGYFRALAEVDVIAADDAIHDPRTSEFADDYLRPLGIQSMLDVPVQVGGVLDGVLCHEHIGSPRSWTTDEKTFAVAMANLVSLALEGGERREAERAVAEKTEVLEAIFNNAPVMLCFIDAHGRLRMANREFERVFGWKLAEMHDHANVFEEWYPDAGYRARVMEFIRGGAGQFAEFQTRVRNGNVITTSFASVTLSGGTSLCIGLDITERKEAEEALQKTEREQRQLAQQLEIERARLVAAQRVAKVGSWETDVATLAVIWSEETHRIFETDPATFHPTHQAFLNFVHPEDRAALEQAFVSSFDLRVASVFEHRLLLPDGRVKFIEERWQVLHDVQGKPVRATGTCQDITERKRSERQLAAFATLGRRLGGATTATEAARIIVETADGLFGWDACWLHMYDRILDRSSSVLNIDIVDGRRQDVPPAYADIAPSPGVRRAIEKGAQLILREKLPVNSPDLVPFGDTSRPSASIMVVPVRHGGELIAVLSIQSYSFNAYRAEDLLAMEALADYCGGALAQIRAREARRESEERFRELAETIQEVFWITDPNKNRMLYISPAYEKIWGRSGESLYDSPRNWIEAIHPDDRERVLHAATTRQTEGTYDEEYRIIRPDGEIRWVKDRAFPVRNAAGQIERVVGVARDVTERKKAEAELQRREEEFRSLIENASDLITVVNGQGIIRFQSPSAERVLGYSPESMTGRNALEMIHPDDAAYTAATLRMALADSSAPVSVEYRFRHRDGSWRFLQSVGRNIPNQAADGFIVINSRDITERRMLEEQFRQSQKMEAIGQLAGGVAHDFNNILTVIQGYGSLLLMSEEKSANATEAVQEILDASERAANLTRQLLAFSRRQVMQPRQLDLNEVITSLTKMLQRILGEDVRLQLNLHPRPLMTRADAGMIDQVLMNLVINARDAMPKGGQLFIETGEKNFTAEEARSIPDAMPGRHVCIRVTDTGSGISPENLSRIFEPFFTTKEPGKGTGLGLATVFGIIKQHGGSLRVESEIGRGTTFHIFLPASQDTTEQSAEGQVKPMPRGGSETILIVEDEPSVRALKRVLLERQGYHVLEAAHGVEALRVWEQHQGPIQLLLTDIVMPEGISGRDLAVRLLERDPKLRVIFTSGYSADIAGRELTLREGQNFLQKPCPPHVLLETVRRCLDS